MAFDPVPWAVGNGALVDMDVARTLANISTQDSSGVNLPADMKVSTGSGMNVTVAPGGITIRNAQQSGESYVGKALTPTDVPITATGAGGSRTDLLIARVIDPQYSPWQNYYGAVNPPLGPYFQPWVVPNVSPSTKTADQVVSYAAEALALITVPANTTSSLAGATITDLRRLARARTWRDFQMFQLATGATQQNLPVTQTTWTDWPLFSYTTTVPRWATHALVALTINQVKTTGFADMLTRISFGSLTSAGNQFDYDGPASPGNPDGNSFTIFAEFDVHTLQGQTAVVKPQAERTFTTNTGLIFIEQSNQVVFDIGYREKPL